jgi:hypothetical protein
MIKLWKVGLLALAVAIFFSSCGGDTEETPAANTTEEVVGIYKGISTLVIKTGPLTPNLVFDITETDSINVVVTKNTTGFTLSIDDNDATTPSDPALINVNDVTLASNGTSMQLPSQTFIADSSNLTVVGLKAYWNSTTPVAGLYTRATKNLKLKASGTIAFPVNDSTEVQAPIEIVFNVIKK